MGVSKTEISGWFQSLQDDICSQLEEFDGVGTFHEDKWEREGGGGGKTRIIEGALIEKGGVNFSAVHGTLNDVAIKKLDLSDNEFFATGVSIVLHPKNPFIPIIHMNVRYFELSGGKTWWFGGGIDLTPHYIDESQAKYFHQELKSTCDKHHDSYYPNFKTHADNYFYIKHRNETRGIGGIFFDRLKDDKGFTKESRFDFVKDVGNTFAPTYLHLANLNKNKAYGQNEIDWQMLRRGRYVEFNLVWDAGTKFGLETNGRTESILMSLPKTAQWTYDFKPLPNSEEEKTLGLLKKDINWLK